MFLVFFFNVTFGDRLENMTSGGNNFNDFSENQITKVRAV